MVSITFERKTVVCISKNLNHLCKSNYFYILKIYGSTLKNCVCVCMVLLMSSLITLHTECTLLFSSKVHIGFRDLIKWNYMTVSTGSYQLATRPSLTETYKDNYMAKLTRFPHPGTVGFCCCR